MSAYHGGRCALVRPRGAHLGHRLSAGARPQRAGAAAAGRQRGAAPRCVSSPQQSLTLGKTDRRIFTAKRYFHCLWNDSQPDVLSEIASESIIHSDKVWLDYDLVGIQRVKSLYTGYMSGYPDCHYDIVSPSLNLGLFPDALTIPFLSVL
mmetsp:Transcript_16455/g.42171  ORF Transcript_16455/g.42171 Transcript_16455/m.42171 type:complete len:150 (+) Transcript_16455:371-820(+)